MELEIELNDTYTLVIGHGRMGLSHKVESQLINNRSGVTLFQFWENFESAIAVNIARFNHHVNLP